MIQIQTNRNEWEEILSYKTHSKPIQQFQYPLLKKRFITRGCKICYKLILLQFNNEIIVFCHFYFFLGRQTHFIDMFYQKVVCSI